MTTKLKVHGTDLSHHNPTPDFKKAKAAGLEWAINKATEGSMYTDATYAARRKLAAEAKLPFGGYAFARPEGGDAKIEALHAFKVIQPKAGDIVPALDFEVGYRDAEAWCKAWQAEMARLLKAKGLTFGAQLHYGPDGFGMDYKAVRWVPRYNMQNTPPKVPWDIFQFSNGQLGVPNSFPGLGNVDLNYVKPGFDFSKLIIRPIKTAPQFKYLKLKAAHASMQYSDTPQQQEHDAELIFQRASETGICWVTGTEAGDDQLWDIVLRIGTKYGFRFRRMRGNWVAVNKKFIKKGSWESGEIFVMDADKVAGIGADSAFPWVTFVHEELGDKISVCGVHYPRMGRNTGDPNNWVTRIYANYISKWAAEKGKGAGLAFVGGDFNMLVLRPSANAPDIFFNKPLTTASEEVGKFFNTGHGPIDHIASYDRDGRVSATDWRVFDDKKMFLNGDHYYTEADFTVRSL